MQYFFGGGYYKYNYRLIPVLLCSCPQRRHDLFLCETQANRCLDSFMGASDLQGALDIELSFYGRVFGIDIPDAVEISIDNL